MKPRTCLAVMLLPLLAACMAPPKYNWGHYEESLHAYYKDAARQAELIAELEQIIHDAEASGKPVAPGLYAEHGYLLMQLGLKQEAAVLFQKEKTRWPEASQLMDAMIRSVESAPAAVATRKE
jgi:hypothetical protein